MFHHVWACIARRHVHSLRFPTQLCLALGHPGWFTQISTNFSWWKHHLSFLNRFCYQGWLSRPPAAILAGQISIPPSDLLVQIHGLSENVTRHIKTHGIQHLSSVSPKNNDAFGEVDTVSWNPMKAPYFAHIWRQDVPRSRGHQRLAANHAGRC